MKEELLANCKTAGLVHEFVLVVVKYKHPDLSRMET